MKGFPLPLPLGIPAKEDPWKIVLNYWFGDMKNNTKAFIGRDNEPKNEDVLMGV
jgi:hypothetical protein